MAGWTGRPEPAKSSPPSEALRATAPTANGPVIYDFPYLKLGPGSSMVMIRYPGHGEPVLDFKPTSEAVPQQKVLP